MFIELTFNKNSHIVKQIIKILGKTSVSDNKRISKIYCNLFLDEYKDLFYKWQRDDLFILNNEKFTKINTEALEIYPKSIYKNLLNFLLNLDMTYDIIFSSKKFKNEEKPLGIL